MSGKGGTAKPDTEGHCTMRGEPGWLAPQGRVVLDLCGALAGGYNISNDYDVHDIFSEAIELQTELIFTKYCTNMLDVQLI